MALLLRIAKRRKAWELPLDELIKAEFRTENGDLDLRISVYEVEPPNVVRAFAEHTARLDPKQGLGVDLGGAPSVIATHGETGFEFTNTAHREAHFPDETTLRMFLGGTIIPKLAGITTEISKEDLRAFLMQHKDDPEWAAHLAASAKWQKLVK